MSPKQRNAVYVVLFVANTVLVACSQQNVVPETWAHYVSLGSLVLTAVMKEFGAA